MLAEVEAKRIRKEPRFRGIEKFKDKEVRLTSSIIYGDEMEYVNKALESGLSGENIGALEEELTRFIGVKNAVALSSGTAAIHMAVRLAAEKIYGSISGSGTLGGTKRGGALYGRKVFCSDFTSSATVNPVIYEGGEPIFIDASSQDWCMDPKVLETAFDRYPDVKIVLMAHIYGFPGQIKKIKEICEKHGAILIEDACESFGASIDGVRTGSFGDYSVLSFNRDNIITGTGGGMLLTNDFDSSKKVRGWISQSLSAPVWCQCDELGYNYQMSDVIAGLIRGQMNHLNEHIEKKKAIYEQYQEKFPEDIIFLNPVSKRAEPNYWISCMTVESNIMFKETRSEREYKYISQHGTAAPMEILDALEAFGAEGKPVWKPMHMQPMYSNYDQITLDGSRRAYKNTYNDDFWIRGNESAYLFKNGLCLPSDIRMTEEEQETVIEIVLSCYNKWDLNREMWCAI